MTIGAGVRRVLITGAAGNLGRKLCRHLKSKGGFELVLVDLKGAPNSDIINANLSVANERWEHLFAGVDCVVHLAANADSGAPWQSLLSNNIVATINVFAAAVAHGVERIVFASSLHTMFGHEGKVRCITPEMPTQPLSLYGVSKVVGEALARAHAQRRSLSVICLRVGLNPRGDSRPTPGVDAVEPQHRWLSNADLCDGFERAIVAEGVDFALLHLTSRNEGSPWDLTATQAVLGYRPRDGLVTMPPPLWRRLLRRVRRLRSVRVKTLVRRGMIAGEITSAEQTPGSGPDRTHTGRRIRTPKHVNEPFS
jgi:hypothetical protein